MKMQQNSSTGNLRVKRRTRRGNVLVLVAGILVLLVIVASSYLARTNSERTTALAQRTATMRDDRIGAMADKVAQEIAEALFVRPVNTSDPGNAFLANGNINPSFPRWPIDPAAARYGTELAVGPISSFYHGAPYQVIPWTNWPDAMNGGAGRADDLRGEPGTNDTRWLRSTEPNRIFQPGSSRFRFNDQLGGQWDTNFLDLSNNNNPAIGLGDVEFFTHWPHMTNILRPGNGWLVAGDISDIRFPDGSGTETLIANYGIPFEQWLPDVAPANYDLTLGLSFVSVQDLASNGDQFMQRWGRWFGVSSGLADYETMLDPLLPADRPPSNLYVLSNLNGNNIYLEPGERPEDEFIPGTPRHLVSRVLADADGDGRTDSFWFLSPTTVEGGYRQIVAISIVDNSALLNVNMAGQFTRGNPDTLGVASGTAGHTPVDLALHETPLFDTERYTGASFLTSIENFETAFPTGGVAVDHPAGPYGVLRGEFFSATAPGDFGRTLFNDFLSEYGILSDSQLANPFQRLDKARRARPFGAVADAVGVSSSAAGVVNYSYAPFGLSDELELRSFLGHNDPWTMSRLEVALQSKTVAGEARWDLNEQQFLRSSISRGETDEYLDQLRIIGFNNGFQYDELLHDRRRMLTTYSGARNDLLPPWLRWENRVAPTALPTDWLFPNLGGNAPAESRFLAQSRLKLDLREYRDPSALPLPLGEYWMEERLPWALLLGLTSREPNNAVKQGFYFDTDVEAAADDFARTQRLAAAYAANILAFRDADSGYGQLDDRSDFIPVPLLGGQSGTIGSLGTVDDAVRYMGMEEQPFLVEAFYGHLYEANFVVPPGYTNSGNRIVYHDPGHPSDAEYDPILIVQVANPFDRTIDLTAMGITVGVFGHFASLDGTIRPGAAKNFYFFNDESVPELLDAFNLADNPEFEPPSMMAFNPVPDRDDFDNGNEEIALEIFRTVQDENGVNVAVLIDRMDIHADDDLMVPTAQQEDFEFGIEVNDLETNRPPTFPVAPPPPGVGATWPGQDIEADSHWIQWVRVSRDWRETAVSDPMDPDTGMTDDADPAIRSPRYIFSSRTIEPGPANGRRFDALNDLPDEWLESPQDLAVGSDFYKPTKFSSRWKDVGTTEPEVETDFALQMLQKNADFEQIGELLHVWKFGHQLRFQPGTNTLDAAGTDRGTAITFSEFMTVPPLVGDDYRVNRLRMVPEEFEDDANSRTTEIGAVVGGVDRTGSIVNETMPRLPAGVRILDLFVLDGFGQNPVDFDGSGTIDLAEQEAQRFRNARGFTGEPLQGLINVNTAPREVLRALPQWRSLVHRTDNMIRSTRLPEAVELYRDKRRRPPGDMTYPTYAGRGINVGGALEHIEEMRSEFGFASAAEVNLLTRPASLAGGEREAAFNRSFTVEYAARNPFRDSSGTLISTVDVSTDLQHRFDDTGAFIGFDQVAEDAEESALLYAGASNLITSTSDVFTVYMQVRTFRRNPITGQWNALDPEHIIDDSRYVMVVDRSNVNQPGQEPRILLFEKIRE